MNYHLAICDDDPTEIEYLKKIVLGWAHQRNIILHISEFESAESFLFDYEENKSFEIILLDIQMKDMDGVELAKIIRKGNQAMQIIFITGFPDFMAEGYEVSALHYLMKPVSEPKLFEILDKACNCLNKMEQSLLITIDGESIRIPIREILYCESFAHKTAIVTKEKSYEVRLPLTNVQKLLGDSFVRTHRSYIVGIRHIKRITRVDVILDNENTIPLSRRSYDQVNQSFIKYFKGEN